MAELKTRRCETNACVEVQVLENGQYVILDTKTVPPTPIETLSAEIFEERKALAASGLGPLAMFSEPEAASRRFDEDELGRFQANIENGALDNLIPGDAHTSSEPPTLLRAGVQPVTIGA